jgi:7,8-dihydropterin-6-yl-methyl-4-(beta-D-ribofuranosyl)aminobenzene 5'-phosphate synthase
MCTDDMTTARQPDPQVLHDFEPAVVFDLEPVDSVTVTMLADNVTDAFISDQGPARRPPLPILRGGRQPTTTMEGGDVPEVPLADGGFSVLVDMTKNGARRRILFDAGTTPDGVVENMRRLEVDPSGIETIICAVTATSITPPDSTA